MGQTADFAWHPSGEAPVFYATVICDKQAKHKVI